MPFEDIVGQYRAIRSLKNAIQKNRLAHAYLFTGVNGIGKFSTAMNLAMAVNCLSPANSDSCGECVSCSKIKNRNHPDVRIIEPYGNFIHIDQIREMGKGLALRPIEGQRKVYVVRDAEKMQDVAANSLLKTLEEPPSHALLVIIALEAKALLPTIISRCQNIAFNPIAPHEIERKLLEEKGLKDHSAHLLSLLARGNLRWALTVDTQTLVKRRDYLLSKIMTLSYKEPEKILSFVEVLTKSDDDISDALEILKSWFRDLIVFKNIKQMSHLIIHVDLLDKIRDSSKHFSVEHLLKMLEAIHYAEKALNRNANKVLTLETMLLTISMGDLKNHA